MARILLADDNADSRFAVAQTLQKLTEHEVEEVDSGLATLERVRHADYDLVLLDVQMPGMDGYEVCRQLRADERTRRLPVLFLTATHYQVESRLRGLDVGADDFIVQPVSNQELVARIKSVLRVKALADEIRQHNTELESKVRQRTVDVEKLANQLRAERDILRETFDVFDEGLCLVGAKGELEVANTTGKRLYGTSLRDELDATASEAVERGATADRGLLIDGRAYAVRA
ncbi:MAG TPA: response regulator, partial [Polyangia bacterium]|nr:response regulator [Polyangia bacterium]